MQRQHVIVIVALAVAGAVVSAIFISALPGGEPAQPIGEVTDAAADVVHAAPSAPDARDAERDALAAPEEKIDDSLAETLAEQRERLFARIERWHEPSAEGMKKLREIFEASSLIGQGNPAVTRHPMTRSQCLEKTRKPGDPRCGARNMVPLHDPNRGQQPDDARACIDQYEFPNIPCEYPVVYARANEADAICRALGKRICDAHEWEGACAGALLPPEAEYHFGERRLQQSYLHNQKREKLWAYGEKKNHALCATGSRKSPDCTASGWRECGSNTYPECVSRFGVYDLHGNAAEHMNLPLEADQLASRGGSGMTEMKGSWFIFGGGEAHEDDCRWRAPPWHDSKLSDPNSHRNYHLGFRCCKDLE